MQFKSNLHVLPIKTYTQACISIFVYNRIYQIIRRSHYSALEIICGVIFTSMFMAIEIVKNFRNFNAILPHSVYIQHYVVKELFIFFLFLFFWKLYIMEYSGNLLGVILFLGYFHSMDCLIRGYCTSRYIFMGTCSYI